MTVPKRLRPIGRFTGWDRYVNYLGSGNECVDDNFTLTIDEDTEDEEMVKQNVVWPFDSVASAEGFYHSPSTAGRR